MEMLDQSDSSADEDSAKYERSDDPPEQDAVLLFIRNGEVLEDYEENKQVVDTERKFQNIAGDKLESDLLPMPEINDNGKCAGQGDVEGAPSEGRPKTYSTLPPMKDVEVKHQHADRENVEEYPEVEQMSVSGLTIVGC